MKRYFLVITAIAVIALFQLLQSCQHELPHDYCASDPIGINVTHTDAIGTSSNGSISATASGGSGFTYSLNGGVFQDTGYFSGLPAFPTYNVVVKNSWGCTDTAVVAVNSINPCTGVTVAVTTTKTDASPGTSNGSITASATGGTGFTFSLNGAAFQPAGTFSGLAAGNYTVTAKNGNGCTGTASVTVGTNDPCAGVTIVVSATKTDPTTGQSNGSITVTASGSSGFTYSLNGGAYQVSNVFSGLATGNYTITAKNANGCTGTTTVSLGSTNPCNGVTVSVSLAKTDPVTGQSNGSITATASGATGFTYSLNNGAYQASNTFTGLAAGTYTVTAKSSAGCLGNAQITLTGTNPCSGVNISLTTSAVTYTPCLSPASGSITVTASGSTGFTYNISGGAYQAGNIFSALTAGSYTIGAKDANGCTASVSATVGTTAAGPLFTQMRTLISTRCSGSGCHMNGGSAAGYNFDTDCSIVTYWSQINKSTVLYTMTKMPKSPQAFFTTAEKQLVTSWVNAGHRYTD